MYQSDDSDDGNDHDGDSDIDAGGAIDAAMSDPDSREFTADSNDEHESSPRGSNQPTMLSRQEEDDLVQQLLQYENGDLLLYSRRNEFHYFHEELQAAKLKYGHLHSARPHQAQVGSVRPLLHTDSNLPSDGELTEPDGDVDNDGDYVDAGDDLTNDWDQPNADHSPDDLDDDPLNSHPRRIMPAPIDMTYSDEDEEEEDPIEQVRKFEEEEAKKQLLAKQQQQPRAPDEY